MKVYDFDGTICYKDCSFAFWRYCIKMRPWILLMLPVQLIGICIHCVNLTRKMDSWWIYLRLARIDDAIIKSFVDQHERYICDWYLQQKQTTDVIISASPEFLVKEFCERLNVAYIASHIDVRTGKRSKPYCHGKEKVKRFREQYPNATISESYGNAESDRYIMEEGQHAYLVQNLSRSDVNIQQWY